MATATKYAGQATDVGSIGTTAWTNPTNAQGTEDGLVASVSTNDGSITHYLWLTFFNFGVGDIASGSTVTAIEADVRWSRNGAGNGAKDTTVKVIVGGALAGTNQGTSTTPSTTLAFKVYAPGNTWGATVTDTNVRDSSNFGIALSYTMQGTSKVSSSINVDAVKLIITYTPPPAVETFPVPRCDYTRAILVM